LKRLVVGKVYKSDDTPWLNVRGYIQLLNNSYTNLIQYPENRIEYITDTLGNIKNSLGGDLFIWCNEEGNIESKFRFFLPSGKYFDFTVPVGTSPIQLSVLRENLNSSQPGYQSIVNYVDSAIDSVIAGESKALFSDTLVAIQDLSALRIINLHTGTYASSDNLNHAFVALGFVDNGVILGQIFKAVTQGLLFDSSWNWQLDKPIFLGLNGFLTQTIPNTSLFIKQIGSVINQQTLIFNSEDSILI
jgi:hypothetical protein